MSAQHQNNKKETLKKRICFSAQTARASLKKRQETTAKKRKDGPCGGPYRIHVDGKAETSRSAREAREAREARKAREAREARKARKARTSSKARKTASHGSSMQRNHQR